MIHRIIILLPLLLALHSPKALELSPGTTISLLTCTPGNVNYNAYGHSALRVKDPENRLDLVYNYGTFDTDIDNFTLKFARGLVQYSLEIEPFDRFYYNYDYFERSIYEQVLDLEPGQQQAMFDFLNENALPENKYYWYDFVFNNCSSKLRDILEDHADVEFSRDLSSYSFREMIDHYNRDGEWTDLGIDILLGARLDRKARVDETMFLPDHLMQVFGEASVDGRPLVSETRTLLDHGYRSYQEGGWMSLVGPTVFMWAFFLAFFLVMVYSGGKKWLAAGWLTLLGLTGWLLTFMWFGTAHDATKWNLNMIWAMPLHLPVILFAVRSAPPRWSVLYLKANRLALILLLAGWWVLPQQFHAAVFPMILTTLMAVSSLIPLNRKH